MFNKTLSLDDVLNGSFTILLGNYKRNTDTIFHMKILEIQIQNAHTTKDSENGQNGHNVKKVIISMEPKLG